MRKLRFLFRPQFFVLLIALVCASLTFPRHALHSEPTSDPSVSAQPYTIIALPDTQYYSQYYPVTFDKQTAWVAANAKARNVVFVTQLGDIVNIPGDESQWQVADKALANLDGKVPYGIAPGNHDMQRDGSAPLWEKYFPPSRRDLTPGTTGGYDRLHTGNPEVITQQKNSYRLFSGTDANYIAFNLEFCPPPDVLAWTGRVLDKYSDRRAIISTHMFLDSNAERTTRSNCAHYNHEGLDGGEQIWDTLVAKGHHYNILMFLSGHDVWTKTGGARRTDYIQGHRIHQLLSDYQHLGSGGGDGYMRIMKFIPAQNEIQVRTYSPLLNKYRTDPTNQFSLTIR